MEAVLVDLRKLNFYTPATASAFSRCSSRAAGRLKHPPHGAAAAAVAGGPGGAVAGPAVVVGRCVRKGPPHHMPCCTKYEKKNFKSVSKGLKRQIFCLNLPSTQLNNYALIGAKTDLKGPRPSVRFSIARIFMICTL
jgi:hypothetical protein